MSARAELLGVTVDLLDMNGTVQACAALVAAGRPAQHAVINAGKVVFMHDEPEVAQMLRNADIVSIDGMAVVWAARWLGIPAPERVAGIDLMGELLAVAEREGWPCYFLGATEDVLSSFLAACKARFPKLVVAGSRDGYYESDQEAVESVRASGARLLFLGMPSPKKERFVDAHLQELGPLLAVGVGGSFDVWAGLTRRAPLWMQRLGLEWLYRLIQEPRRMWRRYLVGNSRFIAIVVREKWHNRAKARIERT